MEREKEGKIEGENMKETESEIILTMERTK